MTSESAIPTIKVGDKLAFWTGYGTGSWVIHEVTKISPKGRITCGQYILNPDLRVRGAGYRGPYEGHPITPDIVQDINVRKARHTLKDFRYERLSDDDVIHLADIVRRMAASPEAKPCS